VQYVGMKMRKAEAVGIHFHKANFASSISTEDLVKEIKILNKFPNMCGIIVQLPLPDSIDTRVVLDSIDPRLDVDSLGSVASGKFYSGKTDVGYPTALACVALLESVGLDLKSKKIVVLGQGELVGRPTSALLEHHGLDPTIVTKKTPNKEEIIKQADIIISGIGKAGHITGDMVKNGVVLVDAGTSESVDDRPGSSSGIVGDVDLESVRGVVSYVSPVPGGVGPMTVAMLLNNVLAVAKGSNP
jgi:5,10-methylene-tetrahydrofolate dehydrogenase/methenyl tetrahydrofolate cyclohydrolase